MIDIEAEVNKHKNNKDRDKLEKVIKEYKSLALQYAQNLVLAGKYNTVALKLQEFCDRLPAPKLKNIGRTQGEAVKTATISHEEKSQISAEWKKKAGNNNLL